MIRRLACLAAVVLSGIVGQAGVARADFLANNLRFTLYHELGHAVIDQLSVPVFGTQETAADTFGMVLADRLHSEAEMTALIIDMTALARRETVSELFDPWDEYMPGAQRLARAICLFYGLNSESRRATARALGMPSASEEDCADDARVTRRAWHAILDGIGPDAPGQTALVPARRGKVLRVLADDIEKVNALMALPRPVPVTQTSCGEDNAFYYEIEERIEFCSEMLDALRARAGR